MTIFFFYFFLCCSKIKLCAVGSVREREGERAMYIAGAGLAGARAVGDEVKIENSLPLHDQSSYFRNYKGESLNLYLSPLRGSAVFNLFSSLNPFQIAF